jgi:hypothetical protein
VELAVKFQDRDQASNIERLLHGARAGTAVGPEQVSLILQAAGKHSAATGRAKQPTASCVTLLTAFPYRKQLRECREKNTLQLSKQTAVKQLLLTRNKRV